MKIWVCSLLLLFILPFGCGGFGCGGNDKLKPYCGNVGYNQCYAVPGVSTWLPADVSGATLRYLNKLAGEGACKLGTPVCDDKYNIIECNGDVPPVREDCNDIDDDCDGELNEGLHDFYAEHLAYVMGYPVAPCKIHGECAGVRTACVNGKWDCRYSATVELPEETTWDCRDNDCDGRIDENLLASSCFDDEFWKATNGICEAGIQACDNRGRMYCDGQVLPMSEVCGDGQDNDCNGLVDDNTTTITSKYDIVFVIDTSGSMCGEILAVLGALDAYVEQFGSNPNYRFAIVLMTHQYGDLVEMLVDFSDITVVRSMLQSLGCSGPGAEASLDALFDVCMHSAGDLGLSWRNDAAAFVFSFTDELPQSYYTPRTTPDAIINMCLDNGVVPFQWSRHRAHFQPIVAGAGGAHFDLVSDFQTILDDLNSIVVTSCRGN